MTESRINQTRHTYIISSVKHYNFDMRSNFLSLFFTLDLRDLETTCMGRDSNNTSKEVASFKDVKVINSSMPKVKVPT